MEWIIVALILLMAIAVTPLIMATPIGEYIGLGIWAIGLLVLAFGLSLAGVVVIFSLTGFPGTR